MESNRKILVVDDDRNVLDAYEEILVTPAEDEADQLLRLLSDGEGGALDQPPALTDDSFEVTKASSADEAIALFQEAHHAEKPFSTVFIDVRMPPGMDGVDCSRRLREIDPRVYIAVVSAYSDYTASEIHQQLGHDFIYLRKPFIPEELLQVAQLFSYYWEKDRLHKERIEQLETRLSDCQQGDSP